MKTCESLDSYYQSKEKWSKNAVCKQQKDGWIDDGQKDIWIDRKQHFIFLLEIVNGPALYKRKGIEKM